MINRDTIHKALDAALEVLEAPAPAPQTSQTSATPAVEAKPAAPESAPENSGTPAAEGEPTEPAAEAETEAPLPPWQQP